MGNATPTSASVKGPSPTRTIGLATLRRFAGGAVCRIKLAS
jgi:hypothetical protein